VQLAACGAPAEPPQSANKTEPESDVIGDPLHQSLDKARSVEDLTGQRKGGLDGAIDEAK
jgi:hypothetical protein